MSTTYRTGKGDTFSTVARKTLGDDFRASDIRAQNPGVAEPIPAGTTLNVPASSFTDVSAAPVAGNSDTVSIHVEGQSFVGWQSATVTQYADAVSTLAFTAPSHYQSEAFQRAFRPLSYAKVQMFMGNEINFTGTLLRPVTNGTSRGDTMAASCYGLPGVLQDCPPPPEVLPLDFSGQNLSRIAQRLVEPFGLQVQTDTDVGAPFESLVCEPGKRVLEFLTSLGQQRRTFFADTPEGRLRLTGAPGTGNPVAALVEGVTPTTNVKVDIDPQKYFSSVTGYIQARKRTLGKSYTAKNPRLQGVVRPYVYKVSDTDTRNIRQAVETKLGMMFGACCKATVELATDRDPQGILWVPNTTVTLDAPRQQVYGPYEFVISSVTRQITGDSRTTTLQLVLPEWGSGNLPERMPWER